MIKQQIARLKSGPGKKSGMAENETEQGAQTDQTVAKRLDHLEKMIQEMSERLKSMEARLAAAK